MGNHFRRSGHLKFEFLVNLHQILDDWKVPILMKKSFLFLLLDLERAASNALLCWHRDEFG